MLPPRGRTREGAFIPGTGEECGDSGVRRGPVLRLAQRLSGAPRSASLASPFHGTGAVRAELGDSAPLLPARTTPKQDPFRVQWVSATLCVAAACPKRSGRAARRERRPEPAGEGTALPVPGDGRWIWALPG